MFSGQKMPAESRGRVANHAPRKTGQKMPHYTTHLSTHPQYPRTSTWDVVFLTSSAKRSIEEGSVTSKGNTWMADPSSLRAVALSGRRTPAMIRFPDRPTSCRANCTVRKKIRYSHRDPSVSFDCLELPVARTSSPMPRLAPVTTMVLPVSTKEGMAHDLENVVTV